MEIFTITYYEDLKFTTLSLNHNSNVMNYLIGNFCRPLLVISLFVCITEPCLAICMIVHLCTWALLKNIEKNLTKVIKKLFLKYLTVLLVFKKIFSCSENSYFTNLPFYYKTLYLKILSFKNGIIYILKICSAMTSKYPVLTITWKQLDKNENMFLKNYLEKTKKYIFIENDYKIPFINKKLGISTNIFNYVCHIYFPFISKIIFSNKQLMKMHSSQKTLSKLIMLKFILDLFSLNLIFSVATLYALFFMCLKIKFMIYSTLLEIIQLIATLNDLKYELFIHLIPFCYYENYV